MMRTDNGHDGIRELNAVEDLRPDYGVNLQLLEFFRSEPSRLRKNMFWHGQFADVMEHRRSPDGIQLRFLNAKVLANLHGVSLYALQVIVRVVIFCLNGKRQSFDRTQVQIGDRLGVFLFSFQPIQVSSVGPVNPINNWQNQDGDLPPERAVDDAHTTRN